MRTIAIALMLVAGLLAAASPVAADPGPQLPGFMCAPPQGSGLVLFVTTVTSATCNEAVRLAVLTLNYVCDAYGC